MAVSLSLASFIFINVICVWTASGIPADDVGDYADNGNQGMYGDEGNYDDSVNVGEVVEGAPLAPEASTTPAGTPTQEVEVEMIDAALSLTVASATAVDLDKLKQDLMANFSAESVEITDVQYKVSMGYDFSTAISEEVAQSALASANSVPESAVNVTLTTSAAERRLASRRLQGGVSFAVEITLLDPEAVDAIAAASSTSDQSLVNALEAAGINGTTVGVSREPEITVELNVEVVAASTLLDGLLEIRASLEGIVADSTGAQVEVREVSRNTYAPQSTESSPTPMASIPLGDPEDSAAAVHLLQPVLGLLCLMLSSNA